MSIDFSNLAVRRLLTAACVAFALGAGPAGANPDSDDATADAPADPNYTAAVDSIAAGDYQGAIVLLLEVTEDDPDNANAFNYLGYANRKLRRYPEALGHYQMALALDSKHRGAHEYIGELYLEIGELALAEEHLEALDRLCFFGCAEYDELKERIEAHKSGRVVGQTLRLGW